MGQVLLGWLLVSGLAADRSRAATPLEPIPTLELAPGQPGMLLRAANALARRSRLAAFEAGGPWLERSPGEIVTALIAGSGRGEVSGT